MAFPSDDGVPELEMAGPYGLCVFDNKDQARIDAAKAFVDFVCNDQTAGVEAVKGTTFFPVHADWGDIYANDENADVRAPFALMSDYLGRYYTLTPGWVNPAYSVVAEFAPAHYGHRRRRAEHGRQLCGAG